MKNRKTRRIILLIFALLLVLFIGYKAIKQYEKEKAYEEWSESDIGSAILYAIGGSAYRTAGGDIAPASGLLWYDLEGRGNCIEVINRMNEYMRSHPEAEVFDNRKIKISFFQTGSHITSILSLRTILMTTMMRIKELMLLGPYVIHH